MKRRIMATALTTAVLATAGLGVAGTAYAGGAAQDSERAGSSAEERTSQPAGLPLEDLTIYPGAIDTAEVGMNQQEALDTGYFDADVEDDGCVGLTRPLVWKDGYADAIDVVTDQNERVSSMGVWDTGPATRSGLEVGSTFEEVQEVLGDEGVPVEAGYGQTGLFVQEEGGGWIGFLFDASVEDVTADDEVTFIEVTSGKRPSLMRDGC